MMADPRIKRHIWIECRNLASKIREPTQEDIDKYHKIYVEEVVRLFDVYKSRAGPMYDNKQ